MNCKPVVGRLRHIVTKSIALRAKSSAPASQVGALAMGVLVWLLACGWGVQAVADEEGITIPVSGHVTRARDGEPIIGGMIKIRNNTTGASTSLTIDANGNYFLKFPQGADLTITPVTVDGNWNNLVASSPPNARIANLQVPFVADFAIKPAVVVTINAPYDNLTPSVGGVELFWNSPPFPTLGTFVEGGNVVVFYPDDVEWYSPMPFSGSVWLNNIGAFRYAYPQNIGSLIEFNCANTFVDSDTPRQHFQAILPVADQAVSYSWDSPGGLGWSYFPRTPDNRLPNNPNVRVEAEFTGLYSYTWSRQDLRMAGVNSEADLTSAQVSRKSCRARNSAADGAVCPRGAA